MLIKAGILVLGGAMLSCVAMIGYQRTVINQLNNDLINAEIAKRSCDIRLRNMMEDQESDAEIDTIPDFRLPDFVPPGWLLPPTTGSGDQ